MCSHCTPFSIESTRNGKKTTMTGFICRRGPQPKTWKCECGKRTPNAEKVCMHCGLCAYGCPKCDADLVPVKGANGADLHPFQRGVKRMHQCSNAACDFRTFA